VRLRPERQQLQPAVTDDVGALMSHSGAYVNVHTVKNPDGEIRGEIIVSH